MTDREALNDCERFDEHQDQVLTYEEEGYRQYECQACGAEWWEENE